METVAAPVTGALNANPTQASASPLAITIDRWIYVFTAAFFIVITLVGFVPDSIGKVAAVDAGQRPPFPAILHVHAVVMGSFLLVLLAQTTLGALGRFDYHRRLGVLGAGLALALIVVGFMLVPTMYQQLYGASQAAPPGVKEQLQQSLHEFDNIMLIQIRIGLLFALFMGVALAARKTDAGLHKRMMILAVTPALPAAFDRMTWLPSSMPGSPLTTDLYPLLAVAPLIIWDVARHHRLHKAYLIWLGALIPAAIAVHALWDTPWWHTTAPQLAGV